MVNEPLPTDLPRFGDRLRWAISHSEDAQTSGALAERMDVSAPYISGLLSREEAPGKRALGRLSEVLNVPEPWLAYGVAPSPERQRRVAVTESDTADYIFLPRYDVQAAAGTGLPVLSEDVVEYVQFQARWIRRTLGLNPANLALLEAVGDSMAPTIRSGDLLMVDIEQPILRGEGLYVIAMNEGVEGLVVKRIGWTPSGGLIVSSDNERYQTFEIKPDELDRVRAVGRVVWMGGRV